jgi:hypothetical protein
MSGMSSALPSSSANGRREDSYGSNGSGSEADLPVDNEEVYESQDDENEALKKYKGGSFLTTRHRNLFFRTSLTRFLARSSLLSAEQMHSYIASRFASFKTDLERKTRAEGTSMPPSGIAQRRT